MREYVLKTLIDELVCVVGDDAYLHHAKQNDVVCSVHFGYYSIFPITLSIALYCHDNIKWHDLVLDLNCGSPKTDFILFGMCM